ncbi:hypothetical protein BY996DRAFT_7092374 [Phakopsora pachyrhizi]|nr:hypothetical protein BY996DRAFT_7428109 [Phakopsora pachyrhizi]KAI8454465.1 hypothetical protein BY996DRAFT_7092374 [Phakopsora pachyrhizi]
MNYLSRFNLFEVSKVKLLLVICVISISINFSLQAPLDRTGLGLGTDGSHQAAKLDIRSPKSSKSRDPGYGSPPIEH